MRGLYNRQYNKSTGFPKMDITLAVKGTQDHHRAVSPDVVGGSTFISARASALCISPPIWQLPHLALHHIRQQQASPLGEQLGSVLIQDDALHPLDVRLGSALLSLVA